METLNPNQTHIDVYRQLIEFVEASGIPFREIDHAPEGRTDVVSELRGNALDQAAKAIVVMAKLGKTSRRYYLCVVPGDRRVDMGAIKRLSGAQHCMFAPEDRALALTGCEMGSVPPVAFDEGLRLLVDPALLAHEEIVFNACRLDRSIFVPPAEFFKAARAQVTPIAA